MHRSDGTLDFARAQAARADVDVLRLAVHNRAYTLIFGFHLRFVFKCEWLTFMPDISPFAQISQTLAMGYTSFAAQ